MAIIRFLLPFLTLVGAHFLGRFLGSEGVSRLHLLFFFFLLVFTICLFRSFRQYLGKRMTQWCYLALVCQISIFIIQLRSHVLAVFGTFSADVFTVFMGTCAVTGSSGGGSWIPFPGNASSELFTYTSDLEDSASSGRSRSTSSVNQPIQREQAGPSNSVPLNLEPLLGDVTIRRTALEERFQISYYLSDKAYSTEEQNRIIGKQLEIEERIYAQLLSEGYDPETLRNIHSEMRNSMFYPQGTPLTVQTYSTHLNQIKSGIQDSTPYQKVINLLYQKNIFKR